MKLLFLDLETTNLLEQLESPRDIILQLSYITIDTDTKEHKIFDVKCNPGCDIDYGCMSTHHITPEMVVSLPQVKETKEYEILKDLVNSGEYYFFAHNANFDISVLKMVDIDVLNHCKVVDTLRVAEIVNDQKGLPLQMNKLGYLYYALGLYKDQDKINKEFGITENRYHEAVTDILYLILYVRHLEDFEGLSIDQMVTLTSIDYELIYVPFGKNRKEKFSSLTYNQLKWYTTLDNKNVAYTASLYL